MIARIIHYCWFGGKPLPTSAQKYIDSWRRHFPEYEVREWNEENFDVNIIPYTRDAYAAKKYAFVSDYVRFWALYHYGGLYFDTDVEVIRPLDDIINKGAFMGFEVDDARRKDLLPSVAPGLGLGTEAGHPLYAEILKRFEQLSYYMPDGSRNTFTMVPLVTQLLKEKGLVLEDRLQTVADVTVYPNEYFNPFDDITGIMRTTTNTRTIHWYAKTWTDNNRPWLVKLKRWVRRTLSKIGG